MYPKMYRKAIKGSVGGRKLNLRGQEEDFLLVGDPAKTDPMLITLEINSEEEEKFFIKNNKPALVNGYLIEVSEGTATIFDSTNAVSDGVLRDILKMPYTKMKKSIETFTSPVPLTRLLEIANADNKPIKTIDLIKARLSILKAQPTFKTIEDDNVKAGSVGG